MRVRIDWRGWLRLAWEHPAPFALVFLLGGLVSFAYSYAPLHSSMAWKIDYLEERLEATSGKLRGLETQLSIAKSEAASRPSGDEFKSMSGELDQAQRELRQLRSEKKRQEATIESLRKTRDEWQAKVARVEARAKELEKQRRAPPRESFDEPLDGPVFELPGDDAESSPASPQDEP